MKSFGLSFLKLVSPFATCSRGEASPKFVCHNSPFLIFVILQRLTKFLILLNSSVQSPKKNQLQLIEANMNSCDSKRCHCSYQSIRMYLPSPQSIASSSPSAWCSTELEVYPKNVRERNLQFVSMSSSCVPSNRLKAGRLLV